MRNKRTILCCTLLLCTAAAAFAAEPAPVGIIQDGVTIRDTVPAAPNGRAAPAQYGYTANDRTLLELTAKVTAGKNNAYPACNLQILRGRQVIFNYKLDTQLENYLYYPVLDKGSYQVIFRGAAAGMAYELRMAPVKPELTEADKNAAIDAIKKATANLLTKTPAQAREDGLYAVAVESLVMDALASDTSGANLPVVERDYLPWFAGQLMDFPQVRFNGQPVQGFFKNSSPMYSHAIATLALAEVAQHSKQAKTLAEKAANCLLAAQLTDHRPAAWRAVPRTNASYGGWRYHANEMDADISASGWCIIALNACAVADIQPEGTRQALKDGVAFVKHCSTKEGFGYQPGGVNGTSTIRQAIGGLVFNLYGEHGRESDAAMNDLDRHLFAGTQTDDTMEYPLYYAYYATRLNYLRGQDAWEAWRMTAIRQLVKLQRADGSWPTLRTEAETGPQRYATALSILVLRMCLNEEPAYMTQEVKGF